MTALWREQMLALSRVSWQHSVAHALHRPSTNEWAFGALAQFGVGLAPGIEISPSTKTWNAWLMVIFCEEIDRAIQDPRLRAIASALAELPDPGRAMQIYLQLVEPLDPSRRHEPECAIEQVCRALARDAWFVTHPKACRACEGWGAGGSQEDPWPCPSCEDRDLCAQCSGPLTDDCFCTACGDVPGSKELPGAPAAFDGCACGELPPGEVTP